MLRNGFESQSCKTWALQRVKYFRTNVQNSNFAFPNSNTFRLSLISLTQFSRPTQGVFLVLRCLTALQLRTLKRRKGVPCYSLASLKHCSRKAQAGWRFGDAHWETLQAGVSIQQRAPDHCRRRRAQEKVIKLILREQGAEQWQKGSPWEHKTLHSPFGTAKHLTRLPLFKRIFKVWGRGEAQ